MTKYALFSTVPYHSDIRAFEAAYHKKNRLSLEGGWELSQDFGMRH